MLVGAFTDQDWLTFGNVLLNRNADFPSLWFNLWGTFIYWHLAVYYRSHLEDVYDLSWSPDSRFLISGSVDNSAIMWDVKKGGLLTHCGLDRHRALLLPSLGDTRDICCHYWQHILLIIPPASTKLDGGTYWFHLVRPSVDRIMSALYLPQY